MTQQQTNDNSVSEAGDSQTYRSGFIAVVGRPNVGKSTLINAIIGKQVAIASSRPETTRKAIRGILTLDHAQLVLVDTPGIHKPRTLLGQRLNDVVDESLSEVDVIAFVLPADQEIGPGDRRILARLEEQYARGKHGDESDPQWKIPVIAVITKIDMLDREQLVAKLVEVQQFANFAELVPISAQDGDNIDELRDVLVNATPEGPQMYPEDQISEESPEDTIAEIIRGAFLEELDDELPHSLAVIVDSISYPDDDFNLDEDSAVHVSQPSTGKVTVHVSLYVERNSQKPIIIGHHAEHLVHVKKRLRTPVNRIIGAKSQLDLHVKVAKDWQSNPKQLQRMGF
ncbi:GTPase Era [Bifidobacterium aquikefiri]|uniref:GTPase Era n=1 Tax=Bifidobacterium aquikefiri TaxID=1653207 RepID=UPI0039E7A953